MDEISENKPKFSYTMAEEPVSTGATIKVIGIGGGGGNVVKYMADNGLSGVDLIVANTDIQDLDTAPESVHKVQLGPNKTRGLGAGGDAKVGHAAAEESMGEIEEYLKGTDMVFLIACMGGGTGSGASPVIGSAAKEMGILTVGVVTRPFSHEQATRMRSADSGIRDLQQSVDAVITIPNDKLHDVLGGETLFVEAFNQINQYLAGTVSGIADIVNKKGHMNLDFADVRSVLSSNGQGVTVIGKGISKGQNRARDATNQALRNSLLEDYDLVGATDALYNVSARELTMDEFRIVSDLINGIMAGDGKVFPGVVQDDNMGEDLQVTVLVTGIEARKSSMPSEDWEFGNYQPSTRRVVASAPDRVDTAADEQDPEAADIEVFSPNDGSIKPPTHGRRLNTDDIPSLFRDQAD